MTLSANNINIERGGRAILSDIAASFAPGKLSVILGPNGAGKSTLLNALAGLLPPSAGSVALGEDDIGAMPAKARARAIGLLPQSAETHWGISAEALVALGRYPHQRGWGISPTDRSAINAAMAATDTAQFADRSVNALSGGERARVLMARVLAGEPGWILADEPLANLDPGHQIDMLQLLRAQADAGRGVIAVLHDLNSAAHFADHILLLHQGRVFVEGNPPSVLTAANLKQVYGVDAKIAVDADGYLSIAITGRARI